MSDRDFFRVEYRLLNISDVYSRQVVLNYRPNIPPEYWVDANISFYLNDSRFFFEESFSIFKFVVDASEWFKYSFPNAKFIWNEDCFDGWEGIIEIAPMDSQVLFRIDFEEEQIEVLMAVDVFKAGFARFLNGFKEKAESFYEMSFDSI